MKCLAEYSEILVFHTDMIMTKSLHKETLFLQLLLHLVIFLESINDNSNFHSEFKAIMIPSLINENNQILAITLHFSVEVF